MGGLPQGVLQFRIIDDLEPGFSGNELEVSDDLRRGIVLSVSFVIPGHKVPDLENIPALRKMGDQQGGFLMVVLLDLVFPLWLDPKAPSLFGVQERREDRGRIKFRKTAPIQGARFGDQCRTSTISYNSVIQIVHIPIFGENP